MRRSRVCIPCRAAKAECDSAHPTCGRCTQRGIHCSGAPLGAAFVFRNENEVAKRNSQHARRPKGQTHKPIPLNASWLGSLVAGQPPQVAIGSMDASLWHPYPWLAERALAQVPGPVKRDVETRAVERFFVNWTLYPSNHGVTPGYLHELPMLFSGAKENSVLWLAARAMAFAGIRNENSGNARFHVKARQYYGGALNCMRSIIKDGKELGSDEVLSAMILIDHFELMYMARNNPLSAHSHAIKYVLSIRGEEQLYNPTRFSLWRLSHYQLQSWQTLLREQPGDQQVAWVNKLSVGSPDLRICIHVLHMNVLCAVAKTLTQTGGPHETMRLAKLQTLRQLSGEMQDLAARVESWASDMTGQWKAKEDDPARIARPQDVDESPAFPIPHFPFSRLLTYDDLWLAYMWNFHMASQIVLRESLIEVMEYAATLQDVGEPDYNDMSVMQRQREWVNVLSSAILRSFPQLMGFTHRHDVTGQAHFLHQGKMAGRLFALLSMWVIQTAKYTSAQHKQTASEVVAWINNRHRLD